MVCIVSFIASLFDDLGAKVSSICSSVVCMIPRLHDVSTRFGIVGCIAKTHTGSVLIVWMIDGAFSIAHSISVSSATVTEICASGSSYQSRRVFKVDVSDFWRSA